ncbi:MAG: sodium-dependent transporter [Pseudomonadota bacterium]
MAMAKSSQDEHWSGRAAFILAAIGSAVGIGNLVRFPYVAGETGGGAFVLVYLFCVLAIGLPVLMAELFVGRRGGGTPVAAIRRLAEVEGAPYAWQLMGWIGVVASFLIVSFYAVVAGWLLYYVVFMIGDFVSALGSSGIGAIVAPAFAGDSQETITGSFPALLASPGTMILYDAIFVGITAFIVSRGVTAGIEKAATVLMPLFFVLLIVLAIVSMLTGNTVAALDFLFMPKFDALLADFKDGSIMVTAVGQAFFSLSLGSVMMVTYGIYLGRDQSIPESAATVAISDTAVALVAGLAVFPVLFQFNLEPSGGGLGLLFGPLLLAFNQMPFGSLFGIAFFAMAVFAALTSAIALFEAAASVATGDITLDEATRKRRRVIGSIIFAGVLLVLGTFHALSSVPPDAANTGLNTWYPFGNLPVVGGMTLLDATNAFTGEILLPLGGFLIAVFAGYVVSQSASREELGFKTAAGYQRWRFLIRYVCPSIVGLIIVYGLVIAPFFLS